MGSCIICGTSVDGRICDLHEEDVVFEFRGDRPEQLTVGRYYRGTVDGYAEFGVFVDIGDSVTGLLHRSELDQRLESLDWEPGDVVFVQVKQVRDNGNVDLGWSIRQDENEFRGTLIDDPEQGAPYVKGEADGEEAADEAEESETETAGETTTTSDGGETRPAETSEESIPADAESEAAGEGVGAPTESDASAATREGKADTEAEAEREAETEAEREAESETEPTEATVESLSERVGSVVRVEGVVEKIRQTSGPTIFHVRDETETIECAAFKEAGVRAYPEIDTGDVVRLDGEVRERRGELQLETEALVRLEGDEADAVRRRLEEALDARARPDAVEPLAEDATVTALGDELREAATAIRRAIIEERPVIVRHRASADGYVASVALERATLPLVRDQHQEEDAVYHYFDRRPLEGGVYDMDDATNDLTSMLDARERHGEKLPLFVFVAAGATKESLDGFDLLDLYGAREVLVDDVPADPEVAEALDSLVVPGAKGADDTTATTLAANVAAHVNDDVRDDLKHLPAVSFWEDAPEAYVEAAAEAGYDETATREIREAVALEAYYQSYEDKRQLIKDLLFAEESDGRGLAGHISEQFREKLDDEVETAEANLDHQEVDGQRIAVLDTDAFTHRYEFPPVELLLDELHRRHRDDVAALVGVADDELLIRSDTPIDARDVADQAREQAGEAGLSARSARNGTLEYLAGERSAVLDAVIDVVAAETA